MCSHLYYTCMSLFFSMLLIVTISVWSAPSVHLKCTIGWILPDVHTCETTTIKIQSFSFSLKFPMGPFTFHPSHGARAQAATGLLSATDRLVCVFRFWGSSQGSSSLFCSSHLSVSMPNYFYYYSSALCLIWQDEPLPCSSFSGLGNLWTFFLPYTFWSACQVLNKVLEMWLVLHWVCSLKWGGLTPLPS